MPGPFVQTLIAHFDSVFYGPNGDYPAVLEALTGVSVTQALWKPTPTQNSIWQIVEHLITSKECQIDVLGQGQAALARLKDVHRRLKLALEHVEEADLLQVPMPEWGCTLLELILSFGPAHEAHHGGQIDYLKGLQTGEQVNESST